MIAFPKLNFPSYHLSIQNNANQLQIFDIVRRKWTALTPEEWVRQHLIHYLINELNYPKSLLKVEYSITINRKTYRIDVAALNRNLNPLLLCECKAPSIKLSVNTINQISLYNLHQKAEFLLITNGLQHYCFQFQENQWQKINHIPSFKN